MNITGDVHSHDAPRCGEVGQELCPLVVHIGTVGRPVERTEQVVHMCKENDKRNKLINILNTGINPPIVIFVNQKKRADVLVKGQSVLYKRSIF